MADQCKATVQAAAGVAYRVAFTAASTYRQVRRRWVAAQGPLAVTVAVASAVAVGRAVLNTVIPGTEPPR